MSKIIVRTILLYILYILCVDGIGVVSGATETLKDNTKSMTPLVKETPSNSIDATDSKIFGENALIPNDEENQANKLSNSINIAIKAGKALYIPSGTYYIENTKIFSSNTVILGDEDGATVLKNRTSLDINLGSDKQYGNRSVLTFKNIFFDAISIKADMFKNITIDGCTFFNPVSNYQVWIRYSENLTIKNSIFLRDKEHAKSQNSPTGGASWNHTIYLGGYTTAANSMNQYQYNSVIEHNLIGAKLDELDALKYIQNNSSELFNNITRLQSALRTEKVHITKNEQNLISTGINSYSALKNVRILNNIFYSNKDNEEENGFILQDHVTYLRGAKDVVIAGNHVRGWFNGSYGGFKFKSGTQIVVMNNYLRNTGIILTDDPEYGPIEAAVAVSMFKDVFIANNTFDFKKWDGGYRIGIEFSAQQIPEKTSINNGVFINNRYINFKNTKKADLLIYNPTTKTGFHPTNNSHVSGNTRDDGAHGGVSIVYGWTDEDYKNMREDWWNIYVPQNYTNYLEMNIPEKSTLPIAIPTIINRGETIIPSNLVGHIKDSDEELTSIKILNPGVFENIGYQEAQVKLEYNTGYACIIDVPVLVKENTSKNND